MKDIFATAKVKKAAMVATKVQNLAARWPVKFDDFGESEKFSPIWKDFFAQ